MPKWDWPEVRGGHKTEFRRYPTPQPDRQGPLPAVMYRENGEDYRMAVLLASWTEPLGAISPESLEREGFDSLAEFRAHWVEVKRLKWEPLREVRATVLRPWQDGDSEAMSRVVLDMLYGEFL